MSRDEDNITRTAEELFADFSERFGWDSETQADVLVNWCGESLIEPLLRHIQEAGQTGDFEEFLIDNFEEEKPGAKSPEQLDWRKAGF